MPKDLIDRIINLTAKQLIVAGLISSILCLGSTYCLCRQTENQKSNTTSYINGEISRVNLTKQGSEVDYNNPQNIKLAAGVGLSVLAFSGLVVAGVGAQNLYDAHRVKSIKSILKVEAGAQ